MNATAQVTPKDSTSDTPQAPVKRKKLLVRILVVLLVLAITVEALYIIRWGGVAWSMSNARVLDDQMEYDKAIDSLANAARWSPNNGEVQLQLAVLYRHANQTQEFEAHLEQAKKLGVDPDRIKHEQDLMVVQAGYFDQVLEDLMKIIESGQATDEEATEIYEAITKGYMSMYRLGDALNCVEYWISWDPETIVGHFHRADIQERLGSMRGAKADYDFVLSKVPNHFEANLRVGTLLLDTSAMDQAHEYFVRAHKLRPNSAEATLVLANCELGLNNQDRAVELATQLLEEKLDAKTRANTLELLGQIGLMKGEYAEAAKQLEEALELSPRDSNINYTMGRVLRAIGDSRRAETFLEFSKKLKDRDLRLRDLSVMLNSEPNNNDYRLEIATILIDQGEEEPAAMWLQTILNDDPNHLASHQLLAGYYSKTGRFELARVHKERADILSTRPENRQPQGPLGGGELSGEGDGDSERATESAGPEVGGEQSEAVEGSGAGE